MASLYADNAVYDERRAGPPRRFAAPGFALGDVRAAGANRYVAPTAQPDGSSVTRNDDVKTLRAGIRGQVGKLLTIGVEATQDDYTSNVPGFDRSIFSIGTTVGFGASGRIDILR